MLVKRHAGYRGHDSNSGYSTEQEKLPAKCKGRMATAYFGKPASTDVSGLVTDYLVVANSIQRTVREIQTLAKGVTRLDWLNRTTLNYLEDD